ncbi:MSP (Major sperm protein) domain-containing protein [Hirsutella rhossiliensis]
MSVNIEPQELNFRRPFTVEVSQTLTIKNPTSTPLAFKVKTTAPKQYCVRPNAGRIEPGQDFDVTVLLQAMKADPPHDTKCRDKFLVQSAPITSDKDFASIASVLESTDKSHIQERKIRVNWMAANGSHDQASATAQPVMATPKRQSIVNGRMNETPEASRTYSSPKTNADSTPGSAPPSYTPEDTRDDDDGKSDRPKSAVSQAVTAVSDSAQATYEELKTKLAQAEAQVVMLKDSGLRQRNVKTAGGDEKRASGPVTQAVKQADGVPVPIVAILCLLSFLLAYFFF